MSRHGFGEGLEKMKGGKPRKGNGKKKDAYGSKPKKGKKAPC